MTHHCRVTATGLRHYIITAYAEGKAGGLQCDIQVGGEEPYHFVEITSKLLKYANIEVAGLTATPSATGCAEFADQNGNSIPSWSQLKPMSAHGTSFREARIRARSIGSENIRVEVWEQPNPQNPAHRNQIHAGNVDCPITTS